MYFAILNLLCSTSFLWYCKVQRPYFLGQYYSTNRSEKLTILIMNFIEIPKPLSPQCPNEFKFETLDRRMFDTLYFSDALYPCNNYKLIYYVLSEQLSSLPVKCWGVKVKSLQQQVPCSLSVSARECQNASCFRDIVKNCLLSSGGRFS